MGSDTIGDVGAVPSGELPRDPVAVVDDAKWDRLDLAALFARSLGADYDRSAIPGVQDKISGRMISFHVKAPAGPAIIKLDPPEYKSLLANEAAMLDAAGGTGLFAVPPHLEVADKNGVAGLVVNRFDWEVLEGRVSSLLVEDGCQVLDRYPADKYNLDTVEVIAGLAERCTAPRVARLQLMSRFLLSYLTGDGDFHARNMSIMRSLSGIWEPTPVYDIV